MRWLSFDYKREHFFLWIAAFYIFYIAFPIFAQVTGITEEIPSLLIVIVCAFLYPSVFANRTFFFTMAYLVILLLYLLVGKTLPIGIGSVEDSRKLLIEIAWILPSVMMFSIMQYLGDIKLYKTVAIISVAALMLSFIYLIPLISSNSYLLRESGEDVIEGIGVLGMPSYTLMHAYVFLIPALCYACICANNKRRWLWIIVLTVFFYMIVHTYVTTSLFVSVVMILFAVLYNQDSKNVMLKLGVMLIIVFVLYILGTWTVLIDFIFQWYGGTAVEGKLLDIQQSLSVGHIQGSNIEGRLDYHLISWEAFVENPLFGSSKTGGHSGLIDRLGGLGLIGFILYLMIFISFIKTVNEHIRTYSAKFFFFCSIMTICIFLYNKGLFGAQGWLFTMILVPSLILYIQEIEYNSNKKHGAE